MFDKDYFENNQNKVDKKTKNKKNKKKNKFKEIGEEHFAFKKDEPNLWYTYENQYIYSKHQDQLKSKEKSKEQFSDDDSFFYEKDEKNSYNQEEESKKIIPKVEDEKLEYQNDSQREDKKRGKENENELIQTCKDKKMINSKKENNLNTNDNIKNSIINLENDGVNNSISNHENDNINNSMSDYENDNKNNSMSDPENDNINNSMSDPENDNLNNSISDDENNERNNLERNFENNERNNLERNERNNLERNYENNERNNLKINDENNETNSKERLFDCSILKNSFNKDKSNDNNNKKEIKKKQRKEENRKLEDKRSELNIKNEKEEDETQNEQSSIIDTTKNILEQDNSDFLIRNENNQSSSDLFAQNIFLINQKFNLDENEKLFYIYEPDNLNLLIIPLSSKELLKCYKQKRISFELTQFKLIDIFCFKNYPPYSFHSLNKILNHNWIDDIIQNPILNNFFLFQINEKKINESEIIDNHLNQSPLSINTEFNNIKKNFNVKINNEKKDEKKDENKDEKKEDLVELLKPKRLKEKNNIPTNGKFKAFNNVVFTFEEEKKGKNKKKRKK